jgi:hypothetical protein
MRISIVSVSLLIACGSPSITHEGAPSFDSSQHAEETFPTLSQWHVLRVTAQEEMRQIGSGEEWELLSTHITGIVEVKSQGAKLELAFQPCQIDLPETAGIKPVLPNETVQAVAPVIVSAEWRRRESESGKVTFDLETPEWAAVVFGAELAVPAPIAGTPADPLPAKKDDARLRDLDGDGKVGVTLKASIGRLYMAMRGIIRLNGSFDPDDAAAGVSGSAEYQRDFVVYGDNVFGVAKRKVESVYEENESRPAPSVGSLLPSETRPSCIDITL